MILCSPSVIVYGDSYKGKHHKKYSKNIKGKPSLLIFKLQRLLNI